MFLIIFLVRQKIETRNIPTINIPHQVFKGSILLLSVKQEMNIEKTLVHVTINKNSENLILVIPDIAHIVSSGKNGNKKAKIRRILFLCSIFFSQVSTISFPKNHTINLYPSNRPIKNDIIEPKITPNELNIAHLSGPKSITPAPVIIIEGIGSKTT